MKIAFTILFLFVSSARAGLYIDPHGDDLRSIIKNANQVFIGRIKKFNKTFYLKGQPASFTEREFKKMYRNYWLTRNPDKKSMLPINGVAIAYDVEIEIIELIKGHNDHKKVKSIHFVDRAISLCPHLPRIGDLEKTYVWIFYDKQLDDNTTIEDNLTVKLDHLYELPEYKNLEKKKQHPQRPRTRVPFTGRLRHYQSRLTR